MVREHLGDDAVIVATREENGGKTVRVTAAIEQYDSYDDEFTNDGAVFAEDDTGFGTPHFELGTVEQPAEGDSWLQYDGEDEEAAVIEKLTDVMLRHSVTDEITDQVISCATILGMQNADEALTAALEHLFSFRPLARKQPGLPQMMVGPPGAGKTLVTAKLAARSVLKGERVAVITTDTVRAGGVEQLSAFTKLMRVNLMKASDPRQLRDAIEKAKGADRIFIDTAGSNPFDPQDMRRIARLAASTEIEPVLVLPAGIDADESGEIGRVYATLGVRALLPTRVDIARRLGGLLGAAHHGGMIFAEISSTPKVAEGLNALTPERLAHLLMPEAAKQTNATGTAAPETRNTNTRKQPAKAG